MDSSCIQRAAKVYEQMGLEMKVEAGGGGMDANRLNANGIACVGLATGYSKNHGIYETLEVDDLLRSGEMVERFIYQMAEENM